MIRATLAVLVFTTACAGSLPATRFYDLAPAVPPVATADSSDGVVLAIEPLDTDTGYDDERMVYRVNPYRFDYYEYHRWSSAPGILVGTFLERALEKTGVFAAVVRTPTADTGVVLSGRVVAIEEIDKPVVPWLGHVVLELRLADAATGEVLWSRDFDETEPMPGRNPEGLARAVSTALDRVAKAIAEPVREIAQRRVTERHKAQARR